jgi:hypothetical protein
MDYGGPLSKSRGGGVKRIEARSKRRFVVMRHGMNRLT